MNLLRKDFRRFLDVGGYRTPPGRAACALMNARTLETFRELESVSLVRLIAEPEQEDYFSVYGEPDTESERIQIVNQLESHGCWRVISQVMTDGEWEEVDSIGMCVYRKPRCPFSNEYVPDLMRAAINAVPVCGDH